MARQPTAEGFGADPARTDAREDTARGETMPLVGVLNGLALSILLWYAIGLVVAFLSV